MGAGIVSLLLDTHAALWLVQGDPRLSRVVLERVSSLNRDDVYISDLLLLELALLISRGRVEVKGSLSSFLSEFAIRFRVLPIDGAIASPNELTSRLVR